MDLLNKLLRGRKKKLGVTKLSEEVIFEYLGAIDLYLDEPARRAMLEEALLESEDPRPFAFTYEIFPFAVAIFYARAKFAETEPSFRFVCTELERLIRSRFESRQVPDLDAILINPSELDRAVKKDLRTYSDVAVFALQLRAEFLIEVFLRESAKFDSHQEGFRRMRGFASMDFLLGSTRHQSEEGMEVVQDHVRKTFDDFFSFLGQFA